MQPWPFLRDVSSINAPILPPTATYHPPCYHTTLLRGPAYLREHEAIPVRPLWVLGIELHELAPQDVGDRRHAPITPSARASASHTRASRFLHWSTWVTRVRMERGIDLRRASWLVSYFSLSSEKYAEIVSFAYQPISAPISPYPRCYSGLWAPYRVAG